jgi:hypothetical protein
MLGAWGAYLLGSRMSVRAQRGKSVCEELVGLPEICRAQLSCPGTHVLSGENKSNQSF